MTRALVLGSGGLTGVAWEAGILQGLADAGYPVADWGVVIGSSAGSYVGARLLTERSPAGLFDAEVACDPAAEEAALGAVTGRALIGMVRLARRRPFAWVSKAGVLPLAVRASFVNAARDGLGELSVLPAVLRSRRPGGDPDVDPDVGARALGRLAKGTRQPEQAWIDYWVRALGTIDAWPPSPHRIVTIDIATGERVVVDAGMGVPLSRAIAASSSVPAMLPPITIGGRRCMDGGMRSQTNADLAAGFDEVLVVAPAERGQLAGELEQLRSGGAQVTVILPSPAAAAAIGEELARLDPARISRAALAGRIDGRAAFR